MLGLDTLLGCFPFQTPVIPSFSDAEGHSPPFSPEQVEAVGSEWLEVDEPAGFFVPKMERRRRLLLLDQMNHVLRYDDCTRAARLHEISLVTSVEAVDSGGRPVWWMSVLDPVTVQVWVVYFPSRQRLQAWVSQLRSVVEATGSRAIVSDIVALDNQQPEAPHVATETINTTHRHSDTQAEA